MLKLDGRRAASFIIQCSLLTCCYFPAPSVPLSTNIYSFLGHPGQMQLPCFGTSSQCLINFWIIWFWIFCLIPSPKAFGRYQLGSLSHFLDFFSNNQDFPLKSSPSSSWYFLFNGEVKMFNQFSLVLLGESNICQSSLDSRKAGYQREQCESLLSLKGFYLGLVWQTRHETIIENLFLMPVVFVQ